VFTRPNSTRLTRRPQEREGERTTTEKGRKGERRTLSPNLGTHRDKWPHTAIVFRRKHEGDGVPPRHDVREGERERGREGEREREREGEGGREGRLEMLCPGKNQTLLDNALQPGGQRGGCGWDHASRTGIQADAGRGSYSPGECEVGRWRGGYHDGVLHRASTG
jgi:hypothetical protein